MLATFTRAQIAAAGAHEISDALESGRIVCFPECPVDLPSAEDLEFLRQEMPKHLSSKNISFHPEADRIVGIKGSKQVVERAQRILKEQNARIQAFLKKAIPALTKDWTVGTASFRPLQEKGRDLPAHASNEL